MNEQFLSRNKNEIIDVFLAYRELLTVRDHFVLYHDKECWELFDPNVGRTIFRYKWKHVKTFKEAIYKLRYDIVNVGVMLYCNSRNDERPPSQKEAWAMKALQKIYSLEEIQIMYEKGTNL